MRKHKTPAEALLWAQLQAKRFFGSKWRQQYPVDGYILDFYCPRSKLAIELDGSQHDETETQAYDRIRTELLQTRAIRVLRFTNQRVMTDNALVLDTIEANLV
jgi:very-short-patch-repair endonuclease